jgi:hypothetical protein
MKGYQTTSLPSPTSLHSPRSPRSMPTPRAAEVTAIRKRMRELETVLDTLRTPTKVPRDCGMCGELCLAQEGAPQHTARCLECISPPRLRRQKARSITEEDAIEAMRQMYLETPSTPVAFFTEDEVLEAIRQM